MYGLLYAIEDHFGLGKSTALTDREDAIVSEACGVYVHQIQAALEKGRSSGTADGVIGPMQWQLELYNDQVAMRNPIPDNFVVGPESEN
jgi:hypothetical protein